MPRYIIERNLPDLKDLKGLTAQELAEELGQDGRKSNKVLADMTGVIWIRSYVSVAEGKIFCEYDAPNPEAILEHARRAGFPADKISEVALEISPDMFV